MRFFRLFFVSIFLFGLGVIPATVAAQSVAETEQAELAGPWHGRWTAPEGGITRHHNAWTGQFFLS